MGNKYFFIFIVGASLVQSGLTLDCLMMRSNLGVIISVASIDCYECLRCNSEPEVKKSCPQESRSCMTTTEVFNNQTVGINFTIKIKNCILEGMGKPQPKICCSRGFYLPFESHIISLQQCSVGGMK